MFEIILTRFTVGGINRLLKKKGGKGSARVLVLNDKENDRIQKVLQFEGESGKRAVSWLAPNAENLERILRPFRVSGSGTSEEESDRSRARRVGWKRRLQESEASDSSES